MQFCNAFIGNGYNAYIGLDGTERVVGGLCARLGDCVEQGALSYIGKT